MTVMYTFMFLLLGLSSSLPLIKGHGNNSFTYLMFTQFWPPASCIYMEEHREGCKIPSYINGWTIHGLWPSRPGSELPQNCDPSMPFDFSKIQSLVPELTVNWHYYGTGESPQYLWNHEWNKHGTCAYSLPALQGELRYFNKTLQIHSQVNMTNILAKSGVVPSESETYKMKEFNKAVKNFYKFEPVIKCNYDRKTKRTYLEQISLCYDKSFNLQDCYQDMVKVHSPSGEVASKYYEGCENKDNIIYLPLRQGSQLKKNALVFASEKSRG